MANRKPGEIFVPITTDIGDLDRELRAGVAKIRSFGESAKVAGSGVDKFEASAKKAATANSQLFRGMETGAGTFKKTASGLLGMGTALGKAREQAGKTHEAFVSGREKLSRYIMALGSVGTAVGLLRSGLQGLAQDAKRGIDSIQGTTDSRQRLSQVATSADDLQSMIGRADSASMKFGIDRARMQQLMFDARSTGFEGDFESVARASQLVGSEAAGTVAGRFRQLFASEGLSSQQAISGALIAAQKSNLDFADIAAATPQAAEMAASAGTGSSELLASLSVLSGRFKSGQTAGDRLKAFQGMIAKNEGLRGKGILGAFDELRGMSDEDRRSTLGDSVEVNAVYDALKADADTIRQRRREIAADIQGGGAALTTQLTIQASDTTRLIERQRAAAEQERNLSLEGAGRREMIRQGMIDRGRARDSRGTATDQAINRGVGAVMDATGITDGFIGRAVLSKAVTMEEKVASQEAFLAKKQAEQQTRLQQEMVAELKKQNNNAIQPPVAERIP